jgi:hypothetical protein
MNMIRKGQMQGVNKGDSLSQARLIAELFEVAISAQQDRRASPKLSLSDFLQHNPANSFMALRNGHNHRLPEVFRDQRFFRNRDGSAALPGRTSWNADKNVRDRCGCRIPRAWRIAVPANYVRAVKNVAPTEPDG